MSLRIFKQDLEEGIRSERLKLLVCQKFAVVQQSSSRVWSAEQYHYAAHVAKEVAAILPCIVCIK